MDNIEGACTTIPLNKLLLSPRNARKTDVEEDIQSLADSIHSKGLLQNLVVSKAAGNRGFYDVDAGGRRWRALQINVQMKRIPRNWPVPVFIIPADDAAEASLAENLQRIMMNPADEVEAFAAIIQRYADNGIVDRAAQVANLARRFGRTETYVEQRLRLAALAPDILDALREGRVPLDAAKAYAAVSDQKLQLSAFAAQEKAAYEKHRPAAIRAAYAGKVYRRGDRIVRYVGFDAYIAAGGRSDIDLFMGSEEDEVLLDVTLVDQLAKEKADAEARALAEAAGFAGAVTMSLTAQHWVWPKTPAGFREANSIGRLEPEHKASWLVLVNLAVDGTALSLTNFGYEPLAAAQPADGQPPRQQSSPPAPQRAHESGIERLARIRRQKIEARAVRLAAPVLAGTPLEGRAHWPELHERYVPPLLKDEETGDYVVAILIKIPAADVDRVTWKAEQLLDAEESRTAQTPGASGPDYESDDEFEAPAREDEVAREPESVA